ncbi:hypothetical protein BSKO_03568 [Bryopsis sp. KO-2023]|nr:hypothetical protein BSKO_03568 [Bryopsis sp. KO-2023]
MDVQHLCTVLQSCLSHNTDEIKAAESILSQHETQKGQVQNLLRVAVEGTLDPALRQSAAIYFKRLVERRWEPKDKEKEGGGLFEEDKAEVRNNIVQAVVRSPPLIQKQFVEVLRSIIHADFPQNWPGLKDTIVQSVHSKDEAEVYGGLVALRWVARKFEFRQEDKEPLYDILNVTQPKICEFMSSLATADNSSPGAAELLKINCKIIWALTFSVIPRGLLEQGNFSTLMQALLVLVTKDVPVDQMPQDPDEQETWCWWKAKKWVLHLTIRFFKYHGKVDASKEENKAFSQMYIDKVMLPMLEAHMQLLSKMMQLPRPNKRILTILLQYMQHAVTHAGAFKVLKDHAKLMLINVALPLMYFSQEDAELFTTDPQEFVRKGFDILEDIYSTKTAAVNFTYELCKNKGKLVLADYVQHLGGIMTEHNAALQAGNVPNDIARKMDGALLGIGAIDDILKRKKSYKHNMEGLLLEFVVPCFGSTHAHLRARACWVAGEYADLKMKDGKGTGPTFGMLLEKVVALMRDPELPVRIDSVVALRHFIDALAKLDDLKPILPQLLEECFKLMNEVDNDDMVATLETIVEKFGEEIAPYAEGLAMNLVKAFFKCMETTNEDEDEEDMGALAAVGCLRAINTLLDSVNSMPQIYPKLEEICFPILEKMLKEDALDIIEELMSMMSYFVYFGGDLSPRMWSLLPRLQEAVTTWAADFFEEMLVPLETFVVKGNEIFLTCKNPDYLTCMNQMIEHVVSNVDSELEVVPAPQLMEIVLQNCKGRVDECVAPYLLLSATKLQNVERSKLMVALINVFANAFYYNPVLTLQVMKQQGSLQTVMSKWFEMIFAAKPDEKWKYFKRMQDKKVSILGLTALISIPDEVLTPEIRDGMSQILNGIMKLLIALKEQEEAAGDESSDDFDPESDSEEEEEEEEEDHDDDTIASKESEYIKRLHREARSLFGLVGSSDSDDDFTDEEDEETPVAKIDAFKTFADALGMVEKTNPARAQALMAGVDQSVQAALRGMVEYAASRPVPELNGVANGH